MDAHLSVSLQTRWQPQIIHLLFLPSYKAIRINNRIINYIDKAPLTPEQKNEILGQAYFYRSWFYFQVIKRYGGMPIIDKVFEGGDDDIPRMTYHESHDWMMEDIQKAIYM